MNLLIDQIQDIKKKWLGEFPAHWDLKRLGGLFEERNETVSENDYIPLSVTMKGIVLQLESAAKTIHVDNRKKVCVNDFAINSRSDRRGSGGISKLEGSVSIVNIVLKPSKYYIPEYTHYLLTNILFQDEYYSKGKGIVADMWSTKFSDMKNIYLPVPPKSEQDAIVQYIKAKEEKINRFIEKKKRFIELLKEQRQVVISDKLTIADNKYEAKRLKYICYLQRGHDLSKENFVEEGELFPVYGSNGIIGYHNQFTTKGPCLTVGRSGSVGKVNIIEEDFWAHNTCLYVNNNFGNDWNYLFYVLSSIDIKMASNGSAVPTLDRKDVHELKFPIPPLEEQKQIVSHIKAETATIDTAIAKAEREIELIREYKEAMISEAVMGKIL